MNETGLVEVDQFLPHPPERVWPALTEADKLARWLMPNDFALSVGHRFAFRTEPDPESGFDGVIDCEVLDFEELRSLRISWCGGGLDTTVTWTLVPEGTGTRLLIVHDGFDPDDPVQQMTRTMLDGGWRSHLMRRLIEVVDQGPQPQR